MQVIRIRELHPEIEGNNAIVIFSDGIEHPIRVTNPPAELQDIILEAHFEGAELGHPVDSPTWASTRSPAMSPHLDSRHQEKEVDPQPVETTIRRYGEALFEQVFGDSAIYSEYRTCVAAGPENVLIEVCGSPKFNEIHWEALKDPDRPHPLVLDATLVRRNLDQTPEIRVRDSSSLNILVVCSRPQDSDPTEYRTVSHPVAVAMNQTHLPVHVQFLRPGTYDVLQDHLDWTREEKGTGFYHIIHFDVPGTDWDNSHSGTESNVKLLFEKEERDGFKLVASTELAELLITHEIPVAIFTASRSGKQVGHSDTSLGNQLVKAGVRMVVGIAYSLSADAKHLMLQNFYRGLFTTPTRNLTAAVRKARLALWNRKERHVDKSQIQLANWLLPVVYQNGEVIFSMPDRVGTESTDLSEWRQERYLYLDKPHDWIDRGQEILQIERLVFSHTNILLVHGERGIGKTTLLHQLGEYWYQTRLVKRVFYYGYHKQSWSLDDLVSDMAQNLYSPFQYNQFSGLTQRGKYAKLTDTLRAERYLLILDNLQSVSGSHLAPQNVLSRQEKLALRDFLSGLRGGRTLILLASWENEEWLAESTYGSSTYRLPELSPRAAYAFADLVLKRNGTTAPWDDQQFQKLLSLLHGNPLAIERTLEDLSDSTPDGILAAWQVAVTGENVNAADRTIGSIRKAVYCCFGGLSAEHQSLLACLAPFRQVLNARFSPRWYDPLSLYTEYLRQRFELRAQNFELLPELLEEVESAGLLSPHSYMHGFLQIDPVLSYYAANRLKHECVEVKRAIELAFTKAYNALGAYLNSQLKSEDPLQNQLAQVVMSLERGNFVAALEYAVKYNIRIPECCNVVETYESITQNQEQREQLTRSRGDYLNIWKGRPVDGLQTAELVNEVKKLIEDPSAAMYSEIAKASGANVDRSVR